MDPEVEMKSFNTKRKGSWITFPFIFGALACWTLANIGWQGNLIVYLIEKFNFKSIDAAQVFNKVNAGMSFSPIIGAIIADSFLGSFSVMAIASCLCFLGTLVITLTSIIDSMRPKPCQIGLSSICESPSKFQYAVLYGDFVICCIGFGITRLSSTLGADQFDKPKDQASFINWLFFGIYFSGTIGSTCIVYIQDNVSWSAGFGICLGATFIGLIVFLAGTPFYPHDKPKGSPFTSLAQVAVASIRKINMPTRGHQNLYYQSHDASHVVPPELTNTFRFLNKAAMETDGDKNSDGTIAKPWRLCTVQQVEDFKTLVKILPICSSNILAAVEPSLIQGSFTVLQALAMDRQLGYLKIPAGTIPVVGLISASASLTLIDRFFPLLWKKVMRKLPTPLQRLGVGHVVTASAMVVAALVEKRRLGMNNNNDHIKLMSAVWLFPQIILIGIAEAFLFPGQVVFYYQEFPVSLRTTATSVSSLILGIAYYISTAFIDIIRAHSDWLPDNIDHGRLDNVFWVLVVICTINFGYFLCCAKLFKYKHNDENVVAETYPGSAN